MKHTRKLYFKFNQLNKMNLKYTFFFCFFFAGITTLESWRSRETDIVEWGNWVLDAFRHPGPTKARHLNGKHSY